MEKRKIITFTVEATNVTGKLFLTQEMGRGQYGDDEVMLLVNVPDQSPIVAIRGERWMVDSASIVRAVCAEVTGEMEDLG